MASNWADLETQVYGARFSVSAESGGGAIVTTIQLTDRNGQDLKQRVAVPFYFASTATGSAIATAASGAVAIANSNGLLIAETAKLSGIVVSSASGRIDISITEAGALTTYIVLVLPTGQLAISPAIVHAA